MKKLLIIVLVISLPLIAFFQYQDYRRFNPPTDYEYALSDSIDLYYHLPSLVDEYFAKTMEIGLFARSQWTSEAIDVRFPDNESVTETNAAKYYQRLLSRVKQLEQILTASAMLKAKGFNNEDIKLIESGAPAEWVKWRGAEQRMDDIALGAEGQVVWLIQKKLIAKGYEHKLDGVFGIDTQKALTSFQKDNDLYPSGRMGKATFYALFGN